MAFINTTRQWLPILKLNDQFFMTEQLANLSLGSHTKIPPPLMLTPLRLMGIILNKRPRQPFIFNSSLHNNNYINNKLNSSAFRDLRRPPPHPHLLRTILIRISRQ